MVSLFSPFENTPPSLMSWLSPKEQKQEFVVGYLHDAMSDTSRIEGLNNSHFLRASSFSVIPPAI